MNKERHVLTLRNDKFTFKKSCHFHTKFHVHLEPVSIALLGNRGFVDEICKIKMR